MNEQMMMQEGTWIDDLYDRNGHFCHYNWYCCNRSNILAS